MRGKAADQRPNVARAGITPAHAGKSWTRPAGFCVREDHPRPCGEKKQVALHHRRAQGSPPPMRGKVRNVPRRYQHRRITPAHAGKSGVRRDNGGGRADHPRPCGEKIVVRAMRSEALGSPPPMRGKARRRAGRVVPSGITPAHAGKSVIFYRLSFCPWDHPRPCGEK